MGYSIAAHATSIEALRKMKAFMVKNYQPPSKLFGGDWDAARFATNDAPEGERLSYDHNRLAVGFDYNCADPERDYIFSVVRWMALKLGKKRKFKGLGLVHCYRYDGYEFTPVVTDSNVPENWKWAVTDAVGFRPISHQFLGVPAYNEAVKNGRQKAFLREHLAYLKDYGLDAEKIDSTTKKELDRLDKLWKETI
jgi:hypothetical protein